MRHFFDRYMNEDDPTVAPPPARVKLTPAQKAEAIHLWRTGAVADVSELAAKFKVKKGYFESVFARAKVKKGDLMKKAEAKRDAVMEQAQVFTLDPTLHAQRIFDTKNETYRIIEMLRKLVAGEIVKARQTGIPLGAIQNDLKAIREAAAAIKTCREEAFAVLGIRADDNADEALPELTIKELDEDQIRDLQDSVAEDGIGELPDIDTGLDDDGDVVEGDEDDDEGVGAGL